MKQKFSLRSMFGTTRVRRSWRNLRGRYPRNRFGQSRKPIRGFGRAGGKGRGKNVRRASPAFAAKGGGKGGRQNPLGSNGERLKCHKCGSTSHLKRDCSKLLKPPASSPTVVAWGATCMRVVVVGIVGFPTGGTGGGVCMLKGVSLLLPVGRVRRE